MISYTEVCGEWGQVKAAAGFRVFESCLPATFLSEMLALANQ